LLRLKCVPSNPPPLRINITPVDYAAAAMIHLSQAQSRACTDRGESIAYHVAHPTGVLLPQLMEALQRAFSGLMEVDCEQFMRHIQDGPHDFAAAACLGLCRWLAAPEDWNAYRAVDLFPATNAVFDATFAARGLRGSRIACPEADEQFIARLLHAIVKESPESCQYA
jgi:hypothetical protein